MTKSASKLLLDTIELRAGSIVTATEVRALKWRWGPRAMRRWAIDGETESYIFQEHGPFQVDKPLTDSGIAWWRASLLRKDGTMRNNAWTQGQGLHVEDGVLPTSEGKRVMRILADCTHFTLDDWHFDYTEHGHCCGSFPVFRMHGAGDSFAYIARPWQSGGRTELTQ